MQHLFLPTGFWVCLWACLCGSQSFGMFVGSQSFLTHSGTDAFSLCILLFRQWKLFSAFTAASIKTETEGIYVLWRFSQQILPRKCHGASEKRKTWMCLCSYESGLDSETLVKGRAAVNEAFTEQRRAFLRLNLFSQTQTSMTANDLITSQLFSISTEQPTNVLHSTHKQKLLSGQRPAQDIKTNFRRETTEAFSVSEEGFWLTLSKTNLCPMTDCDWGDTLS